MNTAANNAQSAVQEFYAAAECNRAAEDRTGHVVDLSSPRGHEAMILGDLRGNYDHFTRLLEVAALDKHPDRHLILHQVVYGGPTYPNSNACRSIRLLREAAALKVRHPDRVHFLLGGHEFAELTSHPVRQGGELLNVNFLRGLQRAFGPEARRVQQACHAFLKSCPLGVGLPGRIFVSHSISEGNETTPFDKQLLAKEWTPDDLAANGGIHRMLVGQDDREENSAAFADLIGAD
ncbi:MAG: hypothetical protein N2C14_29615, partial [Planctomycetales bacterium]